MNLSSEEKIRRFDAALEGYKNKKLLLEELTTYNETDDADDRRQNTATAGFVVTDLNAIRKCLGITDEEEILIDQELGITR